MKRSILLVVFAFTSGVVVGLVGGQEVRSQDEPSAEFPEESKVVFKELAKATLNVGATAEILINHVDSPTGVD